MVFLFLLFIYFIDYAITVVQFSPLYSSLPCTQPPTRIPPPLVHVHGSHILSSLASPFPILFLPSPCPFSTDYLCYLFPVPFPPLSHSHSPADNPPCDLNFCGSVPVLVGLVCFCFYIFLRLSY